MKSFLTLLFAGLIAVSAAAMAQSHDHAAMTGNAAKTDIYAPAMDKMHKDMMVTPTGDADADFVRGMIPHHQGAVDMAKIVLEKGKDPEIKKFAQDIIDAQEKEIAFMNDWLKKNGK